MHPSRWGRKNDVHFIIYPVLVPDSLFLFLESPEIDQMNVIVLTSRLRKGERQGHGRPPFFFQNVLEVFLQGKIPKNTGNRIPGISYLDIFQGRMQPSTPTRLNLVCHWNNNNRLRIMLLLIDCGWSITEWRDFGGWRGLWYLGHLAESHYLTRWTLICFGGEQTLFWSCDLLALWLLLTFK